MPDDLSLLVCRAVAGDRAAWEDLAQLVYPRLVALCQSRVGQRADAEELAQETLLRAIRSQQQLSREDALVPWMRGIAEHLCVDWHRQRARRLRGVSTSPQASSDPEQAIAETDEREQLHRVIQGLPTEWQEVLYLHYFDNMTYDQMAAWLGVARATVNERLAKARSRLRQILGEREETERRAGR